MMYNKCRENEYVDVLDVVLRNDLEGAPVGVRKDGHVRRDGVRRARAPGGASDLVKDRT